jgi:5-methylcytosine-specific restriction endonuclease McrA
LIDLQTPEGRKDFYNSREWAELRTYKLYRNPFCTDCWKNKDELNPGVDVHHIIDIADDPSWENATNVDNLKVLCKSCHSRITAKNLKKKEKKKIVLYKPLLKWKSSK